MNTFRLLKRLTETPGISGDERRISGVVKEIWKPLADELSIDRLGSLAALKAGSGPAPRSKVMLAAHMDEIGLMVTRIERYKPTGAGFLKVTNVGGVDKRSLIGQMVVVHGSAEEPRDLPGVIASLPMGMLPQEKRSQAPDYDDLVVDLGMKVDEIEGMVAIGDFVSFEQPFKKLLNKRLSGKSLDNRISLAVLTKCLELLKDRNHLWDVLAVATVQEETILLGAYTSAHRLEVDAAVAIDVTFAKGPGMTDDTYFNLGDGPTIGIGPNVHPGIFDALRAAGDKMEIKTHIEPHARMSGTDAVALQVARKGVPTGLISIPLRYMHSTVETASLVDIKRTARLLTAFIMDLDEAFLDKISARLME